MDRLRPILALPLRFPVTYPVLGFVALVALQGFAINAVSTDNLIGQTLFATSRDAMTFYVLWAQVAIFTTFNVAPEFNRLLTSIVGLIAGVAVVSILGKAVSSAQIFAVGAALSALPAIALLFVINTITVDRAERLRASEPVHWVLTILKIWSFPFGFYFLFADTRRLGIRLKD